MTLEDLQKAESLAHHIESIERTLSENNKRHEAEEYWIDILTRRLLSAETEKKVKQMVLSEIDRELRELKNEFEKL